MVSDLLALKYFLQTESWVKPSLNSRKMVTIPLISYNQVPIGVKWLWGSHSFTYTQTAFSGDVLECCDGSQSDVGTALQCPHMSSPLWRWVLIDGPRVGREALALLVALHCRLRAGLQGVRVCSRGLAGRTGLPVEDDSRSWRAGCRGMLAGAGRGERGYSVFFSSNGHPTGVFQGARPAETWLTLSAVLTVFLPLVLVSAPNASTPGLWTRAQGVSHGYVLVQMWSLSPGDADCPASCRTSSSWALVGTALPGERLTQAVVSAVCDQKSCAQLGHMLPALSLHLRLELGWGVGEPASPSRKVSHGGNGRPYEELCAPSLGCLSRELDLIWASVCSGHYPN